METDHAKKRSRRAATAALVFFDLLVVYALSYGPAWWLFTHGWLAGETAEVIYAPVDWVYEHSPPAVRQSMESYVELWGDERPEPRRRRR
jgi:hypothetical protein